MGAGEGLGGVMLGAFVPFIAMKLRRMGQKRNTGVLRCAQNDNSKTVPGAPNLKSGFLAAVGDAAQVPTQWSAGEAALAQVGVR